MKASDRRRLYIRAGILMVTKRMEPTTAIIEAARQLRLIQGAGTTATTSRIPEKGQP